MRTIDVQIQHSRMMEGSISATSPAEGEDGLRTYALSFSSSRAEVWRSILLEDGSILEGWEVLDHSPEAVDLSFLGSGRAPLLREHRMDEQVGVIHRAWLDGEVGRAEVRFSRRPMAEEERRDVEDGIRTCVSTTYVIRRLIVEERNGKVYLRAAEWFPYEISTISVPADFSVGMGRAAPVASTSERIYQMPETQTPPKPEAPPPIDFTASRTAAIEAEDLRQKEILALAARHQMRELGAKAIHDSVPLDLFKGMVLNEIESRGSNTPLYHPDGDLGLTKKEERRYSFTRVIQYLASHKTARDAERVKYELELSSEIQKRTGKDPKGIYMPRDLKVDTGPIEQQRILSSATAAAGANLIGNEHRPEEFIEVLYNRMVTRQLGARALSGLKGDITIPKRVGGSNGGWVGERVAAPESDSSFDQLALSYKEYSVFSSFTRQLVNQSDPSVEDLVRSDFAMDLALGLDRAGLNGTGGAQPTGVSTTNGVHVQSLSTLNWTNIVRAVSRPKSSNAGGLPGLGWVVNAQTWARLMSTPRDAGSGLMLMDPATQTLLGYPVLDTESMPSDLGTGTDSRLIFGAFSQLIYGEWGAYDIVVDNLSRARWGEILVTAYMAADSGVRQPGAFCVSNDITAA